MPRFTNRLVQETSPYLLQHAHNPVDWFPWGEAAFQKARAENKPILVSIGYSSCHWCHVMERESFEDETTANYMNEHFVNIKVDREERPDVDHIYMEAVQAISGSGGWPLNVFLTPDLKPFYGGTYFPPQRAFNRSSWREVLGSIVQIYKERRNEVDTQAENLLSHLLQSNQFIQPSVHKKSEAHYVIQAGETIFKTIMGSADSLQGGFGKAPKFPQTFTIDFLLHYHYHTKNEEALQHACLSLDKMALGGIYDQLGGGFSRYSTDEKWLVPHFEKMLYDNALLISVLSDAYQITGKELYARTIRRSITFLERELMSQDGGFFSALDADSEGVEGRFYVWTRSEVERVLGQDSSLFCDFFDISDEGNWEHANILNVPVPLEEFAMQRGMEPAELRQMIDDDVEKLLADREKRIRPGLDDKILLGWNALLNVALSKAYGALGDARLKKLAVDNMDFLLSRFHAANEEGLFHTYKNGEAKYPAFLDDYAFLIRALIHLQEITGDGEYLRKAKGIATFVIDKFEDREQGMFFFTRDDQSDVIIRKKDVYDAAVPSGNSVMAWNLYYLGVVFDVPAWKEKSVKACSSCLDIATRYPTSFAGWATNILDIAYGIPEIALTGEHIELIRNEFLRTFIPFRIFQSTTLETKDFPLLAGKKISEKPLLFLCKDYSCQQPVTEVAALRSML